MAFDGFMPGAPYSDPGHSSLQLPSSAPPPSTPTDIDCGVGNLALVGLPAAIGETMTINVGVGDLALAGQQASIIAATTIYTSLGNLELAGQLMSFPASSTAPVIEGAISFAGTDATIPLYDVGDIDIVRVNFFDANDVTIPIDPANVSFRLRTPAGVVTNEAPTRITTGNYERTLTASQSGVWHFTFSGTGVAIDGEFMVSSSLSDAS